MKRMFVMAVALLATLALSAQEHRKLGLMRSDSTRKYELPDSLRANSSCPIRWRTCRRGNPTTVSRGR